MGLHMDNIHSPTVPSGPASSTYRPASPSQEETPLLDLMNDKDRVESELRALISVLESVLPPHILSLFLPYHQHHTTEANTIDPVQHGVNMTTSLTTFDGFPRSDLDVAQSTSPTLPTPTVT